MSIIMIKNSNSKLFSVKDKVIAIIGATGCLGTQYVKYLSSLGARLVIGDLNYDSCLDLSKEVEKNSKHNVLPLSIDNSDELSISNFFSEIKKTYGKLDVLINNAQGKPDGFYSDFEDYKKEVLEKVIDVNLIGVTLACKDAAKLLLKNKTGGIIVNISSIYGIVAPDQRVYDNVKNIYADKKKFSTPVSYAISKAGVVQLTKYLSSYYREKDIRVNCLTPGGVFDNHDEIFNNQYSYRTTIGRMASKDEYNGAILFLCSDASSYMNGGNLIIDGGWTVI